jgi:endonuclease/exonuclease/phosphatase family metal-dependent hydrolase
LRFPARFRTVLFCLTAAAAFGGEREMSVVTLNLAKEASVARMAGELRSMPALRDADVFLLQEVAAGTAGPLGGALGLRVAEAPEAAGARDVELAILSRYPLRDVRLRSLGRYTLVFHSRLRYALTVTADTPWGAVRIVDTHLDTRINITDRLAQLDGAIAELPDGAALVGGDFNSNPFFWVDHVVPLLAIPPQSARVEQHMRGRGFASAIPRSATTFDYLGMHLDWIWLRGMTASYWRVFPLQFSDHHACWARVSW